MSGPLVVHCQRRAEASGGLRDHANYTLTSLHTSQKSCEKSVKPLPTAQDSRAQSNLKRHPSSIVTNEHNAYLSVLS